MSDNYKVSVDQLASALTTVQALTEKMDDYLKETATHAQFIQGLWHGDVSQSLSTAIGQWMSYAENIKSDAQELSRSIAYARDHYHRAIAANTALWANL